MKNKFVYSLVVFTLFLSICSLYVTFKNKPRQPIDYSTSTVTFYIYAEPGEILLTNRPILQLNFGVNEFEVKSLKGDKIEKQTWKITLEKQ